MRIKKENIGSSDPRFTPNSGDFTQVRLTAIMKDGTEQPIAHFFGFQAKLLANSMCERFNWKIGD